MRAVQCCKNSHHVQPFTVMSTKGMTCLAKSCPFHGVRISFAPTASGHAIALAYDSLFINSSIRWPPIAVSAIPIGVFTPRSTSSWAKYQQRAPMSNRL
eukprot:COSAG02_NODE_4471_length_5328_cov_3.132721_6_plen_99_part_00